MEVVVDISPNNIRRSDLIFEDAHAPFLPDRPKKEPGKDARVITEQLDVEGINWPMYDCIRDVSFDCASSYAPDGYFVPHGVGQREGIQKM